MENGKYLILVVLIIVGLGAGFVFFQSINEAIPEEKTDVTLDFGKVLAPPPNMIYIRQISHSPDGAKILFNYDSKEAGDWNRNLVIQDTGTGEYKTLFSDWAGKSGNIWIAEWLPNSRNMVIVRWYMYGKGVKRKSGGYYDFQVIDADSGNTRTAPEKFVGGVRVVGIDNNYILYLKHRKKDQGTQIVGFPLKTEVDTKILCSLPVSAGDEKTFAYDHKSFQYCFERNELFYIAEKSYRNIWHDRDSRKIYGISLKAPDSLPVEIILPEEVGEPANFKLNGEGSEIAVAPAEGGLYIYDLNKEELIKEFPGDSQIEILSFSGKDVIFKRSPAKHPELYIAKTIE